MKEERDKLKNRDSKNSSVPPSSDQLKKPSDKKKRKKGKKRGPKYNHPGKTRNGFGQPDKIVPNTARLRGKGISVRVNLDFVGESNRIVS